MEKVSNNLDEKYLTANTFSNNQEFIITNKHTPPKKQQNSKPPILQKPTQITTVKPKPKKHNW